MVVCQRCGVIGAHIVQTAESPRVVEGSPCPEHMRLIREARGNASFSPSQVRRGPRRPPSASSALAVGTR